MFSKSVPLFKLRGFQVKLDASWVILAVLITWTLAVSYFPVQHAGLPAPVYWTMGAAGALGLFASIVLHEFGHAVVARREGIPMKGITLFIFGGVAEMDREPPTAKSEFRMAIAGPIVSFALALAFYLAWGFLQTAGVPAAVTGVLLYLAVINAVLAIFNLLPAFPLDGGRVLRSVLWARSNDLRKATRTASQFGSFFGVLFIVLGVLSILNGNFIGGMWWGLIGLFLQGASRVSYQQVEIRRVLGGEPISRFMKTEPISVPPQIPVQEFVDDYLYRYHHHLFPVMDESRLEGCVRSEDVKNIPREEWAQIPVRQIVSPCSPENTVAPNVDAMQVLSRMKKGRSRMLVVEGGKLVGIITLRDLLGFLAMKLDFESDEQAKLHNWREAA